MDKPIMYAVVTAFEPRALEDSVLDYMDNGWVVHGGVSVAYTPDSGNKPLYFCQAMIKCLDDLTPEELKEYNSVDPLQDMIGENNA